MDQSGCKIAAVQTLARMPEPQNWDTVASRNGFRRSYAALDVRLRCASARPAGMAAARPLPLKGGSGAVALILPPPFRRLGGIARCRFTVLRCCSIHKAILTQVLKIACCRAT